MKNVLSYNSPDISLLIFISAFILKYMFFKDEKSEGVLLISLSGLFFVTVVFYTIIRDSDSVLKYLYIPIAHTVLILASVLIFVVGIIKFLLECRHQK